MNRSGSQAVLKVWEAYEEPPSTDETPVVRLTVVAPGEPIEESPIGQRISRFALQQRSRIERADPDDGVHRLMWAVLKDALRCYHTYVDARSVHGQRLFRDADRWLQSRDLKGVFSCENVCAVLGVDSDYLRLRLHRWRRMRVRS